MIIKILATMSLFFFSALANAGPQITLSCHWSKNGDNFVSDAGGTGWENFPGELLVTIEGTKATAWSHDPEAGPIYEGEHRDNAFDGSHMGFDFPQSLAFRAPSHGWRRFIYISEDLATGRATTGQVVLYVSTALKTWAFVYFDCELKKATN